MRIRAVNAGIDVVVLTMDGPIAHNDIPNRMRATERRPINEFSLVTSWSPAAVFRFELPNRRLDSRMSFTGIVNAYGCF